MQHCKKNPAWFSFQLPRSRFDYHQDSQGITFDYPDDDAAGPPNYDVDIDLRSPLNGPQISDIRARAEDWLGAWAQARPKSESARSYEFHFSIGPGHQFKVSSSSKIKYDRPRFLRILYDECPSVDGKNNLAVEIVLSTIPKDVSAGLHNIATVTDILDFSVLGELDPEAVFDELEVLADELLFYMAAPGIGPLVSDWVFEESELVADRENQERFIALRDQILQRNEYGCEITGVVTDELENQYTEEEIIQEGLEFGWIESTHIMPHALNERYDDFPLDDNADGKTQVWQFLDFYSPGLSDLLEAGKIDGPTNALILEAEACWSLANFKIWLTAVGEATEERTVYKVETKHKSARRRPAWIPDELLVLETRNGIPPPSPHLLGVHRALAMATSLSGAARKLDKLLGGPYVSKRKVLAEDGSSAEILEARLKIVAACM
ncbi:hypothetical protein ABW21_db0209135 [Orbilia brochopaga]|nr:hypothetical protein ABW21_db0209135 [Drechslerella brochopaga]